MYPWQCLHSTSGLCDRGVTEVLQHLSDHVTCGEKTTRFSAHPTGAFQKSEPSQTQTTL